MYQDPMHPVLYLPATYEAKKLLSYANREVKGNGVWRCVFDTEDGMLPGQLDSALMDAALANIQTALSGMYPESPVSVFVRVLNHEILDRILNMDGVEKLTGFVLPKTEPEGFSTYADQVLSTDHAFRLMPILESRHMTSRSFRELLLQVFMDPRYHGLIDCLRIGANDLMGYLGIRRDASEFTVYDTPVGSTIHDIINEYRGVGGFKITAPVFECFGPEYFKLFYKEIRQHIMNGLYGQTIIHPRHMRMARDMYMVDKRDLESARSILAKTGAVKGMHGRMDEYTTHWRWAETILERYRLFGFIAPNAASTDCIR